MIPARLSPRADKDMERITDDIYDEWEDLDRCFVWQDRLMDKIETIATAPYGFPRRDRVRKGLRVCPFPPHNIYYSIDQIGVRVERILHQARDPIPLLQG